MGGEGNYHRGATLFKTHLKHPTADCNAHTALLSVDTILPSPWQPRRAFDGESMDLLADNIRQYGLLQPITVRPAGGGRFELIAGERRLRACSLLGETPHSGHGIERQRAGGGAPYNGREPTARGPELLRGSRGLSPPHGRLRFTQQQLAEKLGRQQSTIANKLRLLRLSPDVREAVERHDLTERHARALLRLHDSDMQLDIINSVVLKSLNVRQTEELIEKRVLAILSGESDQPKGNAEDSRVPGATGGFSQTQ